MGSVATLCTPSAPAMLLHRRGGHNAGVFCWRALLPCPCKHGVVTCIMPLGRCFLLHVSVDNLRD